MHETTISRRSFLEACAALAVTPALPTSARAAPPDPPRSLGRVRIYTREGTLLASVRLDRCPGGWSGQSTIDATGNAHHCIWERDGHAPVRGTAGTSGCDLNLSSITMIVGGTITLNVPDEEGFIPPPSDDLDEDDLAHLESIERRMLPPEGLAKLAARKPPAEEWYESDSEVKPF
jgi:hypothetical protein